MTDRHIMLDKQQLLDAQQALDISALNGILHLAIMLKKRGLLSVEESGSLHETMTKPLVLPQNANNPLVQDAQHNLDQLFAALLERP